MKLIKKVFDFKGAPILAVAFVALFILETRRQLRKRKQLRSERIITNSIVALPAFSLLRFLFLPIMVKLATKNVLWRLGVANGMKANAFVKFMVAFLIMDYTNYLWHILNHKVPALWRFHLVHHTDRDLDVTTALRFHFGEMIGSVFYRGTFVVLSGAAPLHVLLYEILFEGATQFHHSNWNLPIALERRLNKVIVTPRMHGIHHSEIKDEADSNYSVIFSWWDRIHKTLRLNVPQHELVIGVPGYQHHDQLTIGKLLALPFSKIKQWDKERLSRKVPKALE